MDRREFCLSAGALILPVGNSLAAPGREREAAFSSGRAAPRFAMPDLACDCHMHVYDDRFPAAPTATLKPPNASVDDYRNLQARLGTTRNVVVTPSTYGTDNSCTLDALGKIGRTARGVAVVDIGVSSAELKRLDDAGVRGIRFNMTVGAVTTVDMIEPLSRRIHDFGWHVQLNMAPAMVLANEGMLQRLPTPIVFDHMARVPVEKTPEREAMLEVLRRLAESGRGWIKLTAPYITSKQGPPSYDDTGALVADLASLNPERMLWGTDWPHPTHQQHLPDDALLVDRFAAWVPEESRRRQILVSNPQTLYRF